MTSRAILLLLFLVAIHMIECDKKQPRFLTEFDTRNPFILLTHSLPVDEDNKIEYKVMPYVGNGHLASTIFDNKVYVNGLYNGKGGDSHRARLPNIHNFTILSSDPFGFENIQFVLNLNEGSFFEQLEDSLVVVERKIFAHQYYNRLLVTQVTVKRKTLPEDIEGADGRIVVKVDYQRNLTSEDFDFDSVVSQSNGGSILRGKTKSIEFANFQTSVRNVFMYFNEPEDIVLEAGVETVTRTFISSIDVNEAPAKEEYELAEKTAMSPNPGDLYTLHASKFSNLWSYGRIETDNFEIQTNIYSSYYYLMSSLPAPDHYGTLNQFYGLSPGSLSRGDLLQDYQGHSFWDTETWMYPAVLMFYPNTAKEILSYRISTPDALEYNAKIFNTRGWRYGWESAFTGLDVTPDCCPEVKLYQLHINGDIAYAARQYFSATRDYNWLNSEGGKDLILNLADFWSSRITYNQTKMQYEILGVLPPDEDAQPNVNNSVYTNIIASLAIHFANYTTCLTSAKPIDSKSLLKARCLHIPFDTNRQIHLEYEGYKDQDIKQADVVLIGFPLMWPMKSEIRRNDLLFYENKTRINGPAMTWGMHAIGFIELGEYDKAADLLHRSYSRYVKAPFNTWTEAYQDVGAVNFITGAGGFLQTLIFGYGGLRLHVDSLKFNGVLPLVANSTFLYLHHIKYLGASLSFNYTSDTIKVIVNYIGANQLQLVSRDRTYDLKNGDVINLAKTDYDYEIIAKYSINCPLPKDSIDLQTCYDFDENSSTSWKMNYYYFLSCFIFLLTSFALSY